MRRSHQTDGGEVDARVWEALPASQKSFLGKKDHNREYLVFLSTLVFIIALMTSLGCSLLNSIGQPIGGTSLQPTVPRPSLLPHTPTSPPVSPTVTIVPDTGWEILQSGLERRIVNIMTTEGNLRENLYLLRIDPGLFRFDIAYHPGSSQSLTDWQTETGALVVVNGGFFTDADEATGLIVVDGQPSGISYAGFGGMLAITAAGPDLRWLLQQPYDPSEALFAGLQSFPMLITPGGQIGYPNEDGSPARRTVIAQDKRGRFIFLLATTGTFKLHQLSRYLTESDLGLDVALNLDGGASTGLLLADPVGGVAPYTSLPSVITVYPK